VLGRHNLYLVEILSFAVKWDSQYRRGFIASVCEFVWEIAMDWFFTYA
jgi:hypothetical protein